MRLRMLTTSVAAGLLALAACGVNMTTGGPATPVAPSEISYAVHSVAGAPYVGIEGGNYAIGPDVAPRGIDTLHPVETATGGIRLRYDHLEDGVGADALIGLLREEALDWDDRIPRWKNPPVVRFVAGTDPAHMNAANYVVQMINTGLPRDWQLTIDFDAVARTPEDALDGEILMEFSPSATWPDTDEGLLGQASFRLDTGRPSEEFEIVAGWAWVDPMLTDDQGLFYSMFAHEMLHALGRGHPLDHARTDTVMSYTAVDTADVLFQLDRETLLAVYGRLGFDTASATLVEDLGPWSDMSTHFLGSLAVGGDYLDFGVALRNGRANPWVEGPTPAGPVQDNPALSGSASWSGRLVGFSHLEQPVGGAADMTLDLARLDGALDFTGMEHWTAGQQTGPTGTGAMWGDGDLRYSVQMAGDGIAFGNYAPGASDDAGIVDGGFFGSGHEAAAGVLERDDLTAAFGAGLQ